MGSKVKKDWKGKEMEVGVFLSVLCRLLTTVNILEDLVLRSSDPEGVEISEMQVSMTGSDTRETYYVIRQAELHALMGRTLGTPIK